jgi:cobalamin biosynthetic protein CobC
LFPEAPEPWIDLSTGINPHSFPIGSVEPGVWNRLPQADAEQKVREVAARYYGVTEIDRIVPVPGSQAAIQLLPSLRTKVRVGVVEPTYGEHAMCWQREGHDVFGIARPGDCPKGTDVLVVVNPNNPDGRVIDPDSLARIRQERLPEDGWLIVDEAFADCIAGASLAPRTGQSGIILLKSFGKFFGLSGVRLGFVLAEQAVCRRIGDRLGPWGVSGPALNVATRAMNDVAWIRNTLERLKRETQNLDKVLVTAGLEIVGGTDLYRLTTSDNAWELFVHLGKSGIYARRFPDQPKWLRFGLPADAAALARLESALLTWKTESRNA